MPAVFEDPLQSIHFRPDAPVPSVEPFTLLLRDGQTPATIYPVFSPTAVPLSLLSFLCDEFNSEIERGNTYPNIEPLHLETFQNYWFGSFAGVMIVGDTGPALQDGRDWSKDCLGCFCIKPNYPGRSSHICNGAFLVTAPARGRGVGTAMGECYVEWAPKLGYTYSVFNLVYETNVASRRIWESLNFKRIGRIKGAGILKGHDHPVDALIYGRELLDSHDEQVGEMRFDKIRYYLETGRYPPDSDRQEKSRLRSSAAHYKLIEGKLFLKDREVISDPVQQLQIASQVHSHQHAGINKTTAVIAEKYHWTRIKETAALAIRNCSECRDSQRILPKKQHEEIRSSPRSNSTTAADQLGPFDDSMISEALGHQSIGRSLNQHHHVNGGNSQATAYSQLEDHRHVHHMHHYHHDQSSHHHHHHHQGLDNRGSISDDSLSHGDHKVYGADDIPVDPQVESAFEEHNMHSDVHGGEEIAIARALIQHNESADQHVHVKLDLSDTNFLSGGN